MNTEREPGRILTNYQPRGRAFGAGPFGRVRENTGMKSRIYSLLAVGVVAFFSLVALAGQERSRPAAKPAWEHRVVSEMQGTGRADLNKLGAEGWELVAVRAEDEVTGNFHQTRLYYYMKRQK